MGLVFAVGVGSFVYYSSKPSRQSFTAVLVTDGFWLSPGDIHFVAPTTAVPVAGLKFKRLELRPDGSFAVCLNDPGGMSPEAMLDAKETLAFANGTHVTIEPLSKSEDVTFSAWPGIARTGTGRFLLGARAHRLGVRMLHELLSADVASPQQVLFQLEGDSSMCSMGIEDSGSACVTQLQFPDCRLFTRLQAEEANRDSIDFYDDRKSIRVWGGWSCWSDRVAPVDSGAVAFSLQPGDTAWLSSDEAAKTLGADASICSLRVLSPSHKEPAVLSARARVNIAGVVVLRCGITNNGTRLELNGVATSITYQSLLPDMHGFWGPPSDTVPIGRPIELLPTQLVDLNIQTGALVAMLLVFTTLLGFIWDVFLRKS